MGSINPHNIKKNQLIQIIEEERANLICFHLFPTLLRMKVKIVECEALLESVRIV